MSKENNICMGWVLMFLLGILTTGTVAQVADRDYRTTPAINLGPESGVMRRDPSDIIKVNNLYYIWYTKGAKDSGYDATIWYATSPDGFTWTEKGESLARGAEGSWDDQSVFTPNILVAEGKYWLFYTAVSKPFINKGPKISRTAIGIAVSASPDGPWEKHEMNPILESSEDPAQFDSMRVDDACLIVRDGKYWMYYKGRQWNNTPSNTKMGVAISERPEGPYIKSKRNPVVEGGHEVLAWPYGKGVVALISDVGPEDIAKTLQYSDDGITFTKMSGLESTPYAPGAYRPDAFSGGGDAGMIRWGIHTLIRKGSLPSLERFDYEWRD